MIKTCIVCKTEFKTYPCLVSIGKGKYCSKACCLSVTNTILQTNGIKTRFDKGRMPAQFKGYRMTRARIGSGEYKMIYIPNHPFATKSGHVREHRLVMEKHLGRYLTKEEIVHHLDENTLNNVISNLQVMNKKDHDRMNTPLNVHKRWQNNPRIVCR